jgi:futalosine hydrolase
MPELREGEATRLCPRGRELLLLVTGVGPLNAAYALGRVLGAYEIAGVCNLGIAGSCVPERLGLGAVAVASAEVFPDYGVDVGGVVDARAVGLAQARDGGRGVWDRLDLLPREAAGAMGLDVSELAEAVFLTSGRVSGDRERARELHTLHGAELENMEGFALALGCLRAGVPFLELRTVSNPAGERDKACWDFRLALDTLDAAWAGVLAKTS